MEGLSAYEVWLSQGNMGTEEDFIESLKVKGDKGDKGERGEDGKNGESIIGPPGQDGYLGKESGAEEDLGRIVGYAIGGAVQKEVDNIKERLKGKDGRDGIDGKDGIGIKGDKGDPGKDGNHGPPGQDGLPGKEGKKGQKGDKGDKGDTGDAGKSAYELWLESGNKGSEEDYHQSVAKAAAYWGGVILGPNRGGSTGGTVTAITGGTGITLSPNPITTTGSVTSNLSTGINGGQSVIGGTAASNNLRLKSTTNASKGRIYFGDTNNHYFDDLYQEWVFGNTGANRNAFLNFGSDQVPISFAARTLSVSPNAGDIEYDGNHLYFTTPAGRNQLVDDFSTQTLLNKTYVKRVIDYGTQSNYTIDVESFDILTIAQQQSSVMFDSPSGIAYNGAFFEIIFYDADDNWDITWDTAFQPSTKLTLPTTTIQGASQRIVFQYQDTSGEWILFSDSEQTGNTPAEGPFSTTPVDMTLVPADSGLTVSNEGAAGTVIITIPNAVVTRNYTLIQNQSGLSFTLAVPGASTVYLGNRVVAAGGTITSTKVGSVLKVYGISTTVYVARELAGEWMSS